MSTITISKIEYNNLKNQATIYERILSLVLGSSNLMPPEKSKKTIIEAFKKTEKYNKDFIISLNKGLSRSTYFED
ncbi:MAG: hypothetical protein AAB693_02880 [Patescibacteria group bacterium]